MNFKNAKTKGGKNMKRNLKVIFEGVGVFVVLIVLGVIVFRGKEIINVFINFYCGYSGQAIISLVVALLITGIFLGRHLDFNVFRINFKARKRRKKNEDVEE